MLVVDDELLEYINFDERLSQQIWSAVSYRDFSITQEFVLNHFL